jgi:hypothetical protein
MMVNSLRSITGVTLFILFAPCFFCLSAHTVNAQLVGHCPFVLAKEAKGAGDQAFSFTGMVGGKGETVSLKDGESIPGSVSADAPGTITEDPTQGWVLSHVDCVGETGLVINDIPGGISLECATLSETVVTCTFVNVRAVSAIPTLSERGMIAAAAGLILVGVFFAVRRKKAMAV